LDVLIQIAGFADSARKSGRPTGRERAMANALNIQAIVSMPFAENTYVVWRPNSTDALVIDPGLQPDLIVDFLQEKSLTATAILNTHGHADHIAGNAAMKEAFPQAPLLIGANEVTFLTDTEANLSAPFGMPITSPPADRLVHEGEVIDYAGILLEVVDVPGHSPGHVVYIFRNEPVRVFGGDVLFQLGIGRDDFPYSDGKLLRSGIRSKLLTLPDDTVIYPGHGPTTTVGQEKRFNPFVR
jgi:glyoxylase-like metal-dependent hydrolase (beta-lactamase superfamily II)